MVRPSPIPVMSSSQQVEGQGCEQNKKNRKERGSENTCSPNQKSHENKQTSIRARNKDHGLLSFLQRHDL